MDDAELQRSLKTLLSLVEDSDSEAGDALSALMDKLAGSPQLLKLKPVASALDDYDFDAALDALRLAMA
jgi:hypothetical protein